MTVSVGSMAIARRPTSLRSEEDAEIGCWKATTPEVYTSTVAAIESFILKGLGCVLKKNQNENVEVLLSAAPSLLSLRGGDELRKLKTRSWKRFKEMMAKTYKIDVGKELRLEKNDRNLKDPDFLCRIRGSDWIREHNLGTVSVL